MPRTLVVGRARALDNHDSRASPPTVTFRSKPQRRRSCLRCKEFADLFVPVIPAGRVMPTAFEHLEAAWNAPAECGRSRDGPKIDVGVRSRPGGKMNRHRSPAGNYLRPAVFAQQYTPALYGCLRHDMCYVSVLNSGRSSVVLG
jgi:hypothetical protein